MSTAVCTRKFGGRGLTSVEDTYITRTIALGTHLEEKAHNNVFLQKVKDHEQENILRLSNEFKEELGITTTGTVAKETIKNQVKRKHL